MRRLILILGLLVLCLVGRASATLISPLSLDIDPGTYDLRTLTVIATDDPFTLYALYNTTKGKVSGTYYIAAAIVPKTQNPPSSDFGSFKINGVTYSSANMTYGNPPAAVTKDHLDLPANGIYDTHYVEIAFTFDKSRRAELYTPALDPGGLEPDPRGAMVYEDFTVDVSGLAAGYQVHFDLYNLGRDKRGNTMVKEYATFWQDAQSGGGGGPLSVADSSSTMILLGMAMLALEGMRRRFAR